ncbi:MAG: hypothetical protein SPE03_00145 [Treponema sp.]|nr:hypothetical protein [Treponema sp.]
MGGLTFNIGSLGMFADMMASGIARNNATGQAGKFGEIAQKLEGKGILEINIGSNGIKGKFGMGGFDLAGSLYTFGKRMSDKAALEAYAMQKGVSQEEAEAAYWGYVYGDWTQENTMARICSRRDELHIVDDMADDANAQTVQKADGTGRVITMKNTGDFHTNAVTLGHESYRDGIVRNQSDQQRETFNAVLGHAGMAERMTQYDNDFIFTGLLAAEIEAYKNGDMTALMMDSLYNYSSDADYWKLISRSDGTHSIEWDGSRDITVEYQDKDEDGNWEKVGSDKFTDDTGSMAGSLEKLIGKTRAAEILGSSLYNADLYDAQTLKDVLGLSDEKIAKLQRTGVIPSDISELQLYKLAGEALMKKNGITWDTSKGENAGFWNVSGLSDAANGNKLTNFTLTDNKTMGYILLNELKFDPNLNAKGNTYFDRFVVTTELNRNPNSWDAYYMRSEDPQGDSYNHTFDTNKSLESQNRGLDEIIYRKYDLQNNQIGKDFVTYAQTIDVYNTIDNHKNEDGSYTNINRSQPYYIFGQGWGQGNTVNSNFSLRIDSLTSGDQYAMTIHNAHTVNGTWVASDGYSYNSDGSQTAGGRWRVHSSDWLTSDGCFIYQQEYLEELQKKLREWGLHNNHQIKGSFN